MSDRNLTKKFQDLKGTVNLYFIHRPRLNYEMPELRMYLAIAFDRYDAVRRAKRAIASRVRGAGGLMGGEPVNINTLLSVEMLRAPVSKEDHAKGMAFLLFFWMICSRPEKVDIISMIEEIKRKVASHGVDG